MAGTLEDKVLWERPREWGSEGFSEEMLEPELGVDWVTQKQGGESSPGRQSGAHGHLVFLRNRKETTVHGAKSGGGCVRDWTGGVAGPDLAEGHLPS